MAYEVMSSWYRRRWSRLPRPFRTVLRIVVVAVLMVLVLRRIDGDAFRETLYRAQLWYVLPVVLSLVAGLVLSAWRWRVILRSLGVSIPFARAVHLYWIAGFFNNFLPTSVGGDAYKFFVFPRSAATKMTLFSSFILERGAGLYAVFFLGTVAGIARFHAVASNRALTLLTIALILVTAVATGFGLFVFRRRANAGPSRPGRIRQFLDTVGSVRPRSALLAALILSVLFVGTSVVSFLAHAWMFGSSLSAGSVLVVIALLKIAELIPISLNSLGVRESVGTYLLILFGMSPSVSLAIMLVSRVLLLLFTLTGGLGYLFVRQRVRLSQDDAERFSLPPVSQEPASEEPVAPKNEREQPSHRVHGHR